MVAKVKSVDVRNRGNARYITRNKYRQLFITNGG